VGFLFVLFDDALFVPEDFVEVTVVVDFVSAEEGAIRLFHQQIVADGLAIDPKAEV